MLEVFKNYLDSKISLTEEQHEWISSKCVVKKLRKKQYLLQEGDIWKNHAFVSKGLVRTYSVDEKGDEHVIAFAMENWWTGDRESLLSGQPSRFNIDAIEDSEIVLIEKQKFETICKEIPAFNDMQNAIIDRSFVASQKRIHDAISTPAEEKYANFIQRYPAFATRVPQSMIASYLGITRETLSRIRHKSGKKS
ncbi:Crp/Fnr family transcriptional regulator [Puia dinghuensis]|uniref:cAMP-binding protein n=1 Tax=Puia dinghuensis TaxID=1792502 RepID=A0A8J2UIB8_9BACT|nr:Crp/Fnr family transcriptional regulator [Puia dinghuensis]GGB20286.1 cAMP-binding protein [Puia dinghuensis]